jgi:hypothetical protein
VSACVAVDWNMLEALGTWFAGVATAGSFWLGFTTLRSDRKREERAQAAKIAIYFERFLKDHQREAGLQLRVRVWNHSEQPIFRTSLHGTEPEGSIRLSVQADVV